MFSSVTSWLGGTKPDSPPNEENAKNNKDVEPNEDQKNTDDNTQTPPDSVSETKSDTTGTDGQEMKQQLDEMSAKTLNAAKEWGSYLYSFGKTATTQVVEKAMVFKDKIEDKTIIGEFSRHQDAFVSENREKQKQAEAAVPPWVGYNEEESMKTQILALSQDKRNFLRNPPNGVQFQFNFESSAPVAGVLIQEDPNLKAMRFELVPKQIKEEQFWRNYFYRISLIKQSAQLTSLAQETGSSGERSRGSSRRSSTEKVEVETGSKTSDQEDKEPEELPSASPPDNEFISDDFMNSHVNDEELQKEMQQLGMTDGKKDQQEEEDDTINSFDDIPEWEKELQAELQEYEVVDDGNQDDADLEKELLQQIEAEAKQT